MDTARIGLMRCGAKQACEDMAAIASIDPHAVYHEFVCPGGPSLIRHWNGMNSLKSSILRRSRYSAHTHLEAASNSATLVRLAGRCLFSHAKLPLTTDLIWPNHLNRLRIEAKLSGKNLHVVPIRNLIANGATVDEVLNQIAIAYSDNSCDALFLTAISSDGIRLPIEAVVKKTSAIRPPRLTVVDGAQEFAHLNKKSDEPICDLYLFGSHKWLGAYYPLGLMSLGLKKSREFIIRTRDRMVANGDLCDPLLANVFCSSSCDRYETLDLKPFFAISGAIHCLPNLEFSDEELLQNRMLFLDAARSHRWVVDELAPQFRTGICSIHQESASFQSPSKLEQHFYSRGLIVSGTRRGTIRASMPRTRFNENDLEKINSALRSLSS